MDSHCNTYRETNRPNISAVGDAISFHPKFRIQEAFEKNVGPIRYCEPPLHCQSPGVASRTPAIAIAQAACDVHDIIIINNNDDNA